MSKHGVNENGEMTLFASSVSNSIFLCVLEELVKVGQAMGYNMKGCVNNISEIIESQGVSGVLIMGDFNEVRRKTERFGSVFNVQGADMFNTFIANAGLEEIPLGGSSFTWCHKSATKMSKLDRFLISENLFNSYPNICATSLDRFLSDHRPILLRESNHDYGPIPFRYFNHWTELDGFNKFVIDTWNSAPVETNAMRNVMQKFKFLKGKIREWLKIYKSKNGGSGILKEELNRIDADIDKGLASDIIINRRMEVVKSEFFLHFRKRFEKPSANRILIDMNFPKTISIDQQTELEGAVSKEEVKKAVWDCGSDKSPGPDGFSFGFYRKFWTCIENDVFAAVNYFFTFGDIPKGCNACFIALIPKVHDANLVKDFRPISLIGSIYKIIAKILANRLVGVLGDIVNEVQSAFISDRQILDGPFILNEVIQWCKSKKKQSLIFKVDFEKAYDSVRWDFLDDVLKKFGFGNKWRDWIQKCLRSSRGSIIINGSPTEEFQFFKGLKQGDPLSPFLFILIMESLHLSFQSVVDVGLFKGIHLSPLVNLSHMFYADDAVFVGQWCDDNINTLVHVLECFFRASGLRINMSKSKIMGVNVGDDKIKVAASKLGCLILNTPFTYLGTKVGGNMSRVQAWTEIIDKVKSRLSNWKLKSLSIGGRLTLLKSVLGSIPIFHMSIFKVPLTVLRSLESIRCQFFNGHELKSNKSSWVKWNSVLAAKEKGGLGVSSLFALNRALLMKWFWRFYSHNDSLWSRVIKAIYGVDGEVNKVSKYASRSCWRDIINEVRKLKDQGINMRDFMYIKVGNGETTKFWDDIWIGSKPLKLLFPRIYALDNIKDASICMKLNEPSLDNNFRRSIRGGIEQSQFKKLTDLLIPIVLNPCPDRWFWSLEGSGEFSVASIRRFIDDQRLLTVDSKTLWIKSVPIKVNILAWKIKLEALPTRFNISRRDKLRAKFVLGGISNIRTLTPSLNGSTGWPLYDQVDELDSGSIEVDFVGAVWLNVGEIELLAPDGFMARVASGCACFELTTLSCYLGVERLGECLSPGKVGLGFGWLQPYSKPGYLNEADWVGLCTSLLDDIWLADSPRCVLFPRSQQWDDLSSIMNSDLSLSSSKDRWTCDLSGDGEFKVKVIRKTLLMLLLRRDSMFLFRWTLKVVAGCSIVNLSLWDSGLAGDLFFLGLGCLVLILSTFFPSQVYFRRCFLCCLVADLGLRKQLGLDASPPIVRRFLLTLFLGPFYGVLVDVIGLFLGSIG
ncbi:RNA-directed DNA polymerase, eukaryota [Tanacetum coccineum]